MNESSPMNYKKPRKLNYVDLLIYRKDNKFQITAYRKPSANTVYIHQQSDHSYLSKGNVYKNSPSFQPTNFAHTHIPFVRRKKTITLRSTWKVTQLAQSTFNRSQNKQRNNVNFARIPNISRGKKLKKDFQRMRNNIQHWTQQKSYKFYKNYSTGNTTFRSIWSKL